MSAKARASKRYRLPFIADDEVQFLASRFGEPQRWDCTLGVDDYIRSFRLGSRSNRRAEVVFAIEDADGGFWVHAKRNYPPNLYRLPSGGIGWTEDVEAALLREIAEETALDVTVERFLGLVHYEFREGDRGADFASYVFHVRSRGGTPRPDEGEAITDFRKVSVSELGVMATTLRALRGERSAWGQWRAVAHQMAHDTLVVEESGVGGRDS